MQRTVRLELIVGSRLTILSIVFVVTLLLVLGADLLNRVLIAVVLDGFSLIFVVRLTFGLLASVLLLSVKLLVVFFLFIFSAFLHLTVLVHKLVFLNHAL